MTTFEQKDNSGALFMNVEKKTENSPDYSGSVRIDGTDWAISGWKKQSKNGRSYLSLSVKRKEAASDAPQASKPASKIDDDLDDMIPF
jgi:uncharacterized protein (DUF736 family)